MVVKGHDSGQPLAVEQRLADDRRHLRPSEGLRRGEGGAAVRVDDHAVAPRRHGARHTLPQPAHTAPLGNPRTDPGLRGQRLLRFIPQIEGARADADQLGRTARDEVQQHGEIQLARDLGTHGADSLELPCTPGQRLLRPLDSRDVAADPDEADNRTRGVAQRELGGQVPVDLSRRPGRPALFLVEQRLSGAHDPLLVGAVLHRDIGGEKVQIGLADRILGRRHAEQIRLRAVDHDEAAVRVLDEDVIRQVVDERAQEIAFLRQGRLRPFPGDAVALQVAVALGDLAKDPPDEEKQERTGAGDEGPALQGLQGRQQARFLRDPREQPVGKENPHAGDDDVHTGQAKRRALR